jgi:hypothetical protein
VLEIRHQGHPDIVALLYGRMASFEVEAASARDRYHTVKSDDIEAIEHSAHSHNLGFLAVLDSAYPVRWAVIEYHRIKSRLGRWPMVTLHALADKDLSQQCSAAFHEVLNENSTKLRDLTFNLLCERVLGGVGM